mgnify:CR=1 FL=1
MIKFTNYRNIKRHLGKNLYYMLYFYPYVMIFLVLQLYILYPFLQFYRILNDKVAFIVNLRDKGDFIEATYGFTTIVDLSYFKECGEDNDNIKLRYQKRIINESDELNLRTEIEKVYNLYKNISKK